MPGLLDYIIPNYQSGNFINPFDPTPTQEDYLSEYDIELPDKEKILPFLPKPDPMGRQFDITNYMQDRQGLYAGGRGALGQAGQKSRETAAGQGFAGAGKSLLDTTRGDIVDQFGRSAQGLWTGLQQDIYERERKGGEAFLAAVYDLPEDVRGGGNENGGSECPNATCPDGTCEDNISDCSTTPPITTESCADKGLSTCNDTNANNYGLCGDCDYGN